MSIEQFMESFGVHLASNASEFSGITAIELEKMANEFHDARDHEPMPEEKAKIPPESQRAYQDSRELATLAWLWAAAANAIILDNPDKFHKFLKKAAAEFVYDCFYEHGEYREFYEKGAILGHMQQRAGILGLLNDRHNRDRIYALMKTYSSMPRPDPVAGTALYSDDANKLIARHVVKIISESKYARSTPAPNSDKKKTLILQRQEVEDLGRKVESDLENAGALSFITGRRKKLAEQRNTLVLKAQELKEELESYDPLVDAVGYSAKDGRGAFIIGTGHIEFFDLLGVANRMIYETKVWQAKRDKTPGLSHGRLDMSIQAPEISWVKRYNADYGICHAAFDSDTTAWDFSGDFKEHPGVYRRNAIGWIVEQ